MTAGPAARTAHLVVCAAPPARQITELVGLLRQRRWDVWVIPTPIAAGWLDLDALAVQTGNPVRAASRGPDDPRKLPLADAVIVAPATFHTLNAWATGLNDTAALGALHEALTLPAPVIASPYVKPALAAHPAFDPHLHLLRRAGVHLTDLCALRPTDPHARWRWHVITDLLDELTAEG